MAQIRRNGSVNTFRTHNGQKRINSGIQVTYVLKTNVAKRKQRMGKQRCHNKIFIMRSSLDTLEKIKFEKENLTTTEDDRIGAKNKTKFTTAISTRNLVEVILLDHQCRRGGSYYY